MMWYKDKDRATGGIVQRHKKNNLSYMVKCSRRGSRQLKGGRAIC